MLQLSTYQKAIKNAEHYHALESTDIYLDREDEKPWRFVTKWEAGSKSWNGTVYELTFSAFHPDSGLSFRWWVDIRDKESENYSDYYLDRITAILETVPINIKAELIEFINNQIVALTATQERYVRTMRNIATVIHDLRKITNNTNYVTIRHFKAEKNDSK